MSFRGPGAVVMSCRLGVRVESCAAPVRPVPGSGRCTRSLRTNALTKSLKMKRAGGLPSSAGESSVPRQRSS